MEGREKKFEKSYFEVLGLCCSSEVPLVERILSSLGGVKDFSVVIPTKTVVVVHDPLITSRIQIVKALNQARLEASIRADGGATSVKNRWPSPYAVVSGLLLLLSFLKYFYGPFRWLAVAAIAAGIPPIALKAVAALRNLRIDINILVLIAVSGSVALHDYWEAATIVFLFTIAEWLESRASHKATAVMSSLANVVPQRAVLADTGEEVNANEVKLNTVLAVKAGEAIPIDGVVVEGSCEVDEKFLTGESFPVSKQKESTVWASTINLNGYITVKTTAVPEDCVVARMAKLVEDAQNNKSRTERVIDKIAKYYTPAIVVISASLAIVPVALPVDNKRQWYHLSLVVLVSGCPCPLLLSTPVAMFCALSKAARLGVLIKGAEHLETLARVKTMAFDKTGTITSGEFVVSDFRSFQDTLSFNTLLYWTASIESKSSHPMASALVDLARARGVHPEPEKVEKFEIFPGEGIHGRIEDREVYVGNRRMASRAGCVEIPKLEGHETDGKSIGYVFLESSPVGIFCLSDKCRTGAKEALMELKSMGIEPVMLTGDSHEAAKLAQNQLGGAVETIRAELLPQDKERIIKELRAAGPTAMVGDGVNDAPALASSDVGISMGVSGSALATETGHIILVSNDIRRIPRVARLARRVRRKIFENVALSVSAKAAIVGLAAAGHPLVWAAVLADLGTCLLVIFNSMMLLRGVHTGGGGGGRPGEHARERCCGHAGRDLESQAGPGQGCCGKTVDHKEGDHCGRKSGSHHKSCCTEDRHSGCHNHGPSGCGKNGGAVKARLASEARHGHGKECCDKNAGKLESDIGDGLS